MAPARGRIRRLPYSPPGREFRLTSPGTLYQPMRGPRRRRGPRNAGATAGHRAGGSSRRGGHRESAARFHVSRGTDSLRRWPAARRPRWAHDRPPARPGPRSPVSARHHAALHRRSEEASEGDVAGSWAASIPDMGQEDNAKRCRNCNRTARPRSCGSGFARGDATFRGWRRERL
jgi:hypothetical protein